MPTAAEIYGKSGDTTHDPTLLQKLDLVPALFSVLGTVCWRLLSGPFRGERGADSYKHHVTHAALRRASLGIVPLNNRLNTPQFQYIAPPLRPTYEQWCKSNSFTRNIITLPSGREACWVGSPKAKNVVLYFHGGGFSLDSSSEHLTFWGKDVMSHVNKQSPETLSFLFLAYTLVPFETYPKQIQEAVEALKYLTEDLKRAPTTISLGGDSAGGNICLAVLSHLLHPHPHLPPLTLNQPLKTVLLMAPWVSFRTDFPSATSNADRDIVSTQNSEMWSSTYMAGEPSTPYAEPFSADPDWWKGAEKVVHYVICTAGSDELLLDQITQWVDKYKSVTPASHLEYVIGHRECHIAPIVELTLGDSTPTQQGEAFKAFLLAKL